MTLLTVGLNHNTAPLAVRETAAFPPEQFDDALGDLLRLPHVEEGAILSTCNRTELYAVTDAPGDGTLRDWLCRQRGLSAHDMSGHFYVYRDRDTIRHTLRVASGLDSMILGEPQILGQMKDAYRSARAARGTGPLLTRLFEHSFAVAKQIRSQTDIGANPVSVAYAGVSLARQIFADLSETCAMLIGAGVTGANVDGAVVDGPSVGANVGANVVDAVGALVDGAIVGVAELLPLPNAVSATANVVKNLILEASYEDSPSIRTSGQRRTDWL